jgi:nickel-dependent lactate racemase
MVPLRTHELYGDKVEQSEFPRGWNNKMRHWRGYQAPVLTPADIGKAILNPVGTKPLREIAEGKTAATIAVDDMRRPAPSAEIVPHVVAELNAAGIRDRNIPFVMAHGRHLLMTPASAALKIGADAVRRHPWVNHNAWDNLVEPRTTRAGNQIEVDRDFFNADVEITLSGLKRHGAPGDGGGPKLCLPGLPGVKTIRCMHNVVEQSPRPRVNSDGIPIWHICENEQRQDMIDVARATGVGFSVPQCSKEDRRPIKVVAVYPAAGTQHEVATHAIPPEAWLQGSAGIEHESH